MSAQRQFLFQPGAALMPGDHTEYFPKAWPKTNAMVRHVHLVLQYVPDDDLIGVEDAYVITRAFADALSEAGMTGFHLEPVEVEWEEGVWDDEPEEPLPDWVRLVPDGHCEFNKRGEILAHSGHDLCFGVMTPSDRPQHVVCHFHSNPFWGPDCLVVSERCLHLLLQFNHWQPSIAWLRPTEPTDPVSPVAWERLCAAHTSDKPEMYQIDPEWRGRLGERTEFGEKGTRWESQQYWEPITRLHWIADDDRRSLFWRCGSAFMIDELLASALKDAGITGFSLEPAEVDGATQGTCWRLVPEGRVVVAISYELCDWSGHDICLGESSDWPTDHSDPSDVRGWEPLCGPYRLFVTRRCLMLLLKHELGGLHARAHGWR